VVEGARIDSLIYSRVDRVYTIKEKQRQRNKKSGSGLRPVCGGPLQRTTRDIEMGEERELTSVRIYREET
jgi:hypothetical protein